MQNLYLVELPGKRMETITTGYLLNMITVKRILEMIAISSDGRKRQGQAIVL